MSWKSGCLNLVEPSGPHWACCGMTLNLPFLFIAFYLILKVCIDGLMVVINCRNMKLFLNKGSFVQRVSKWYVYKHFTNTHSVSHSAFNVLNIMMGIGYINKWWPHIIRIIYTFLKLQLPECIQPKQTLLHLPTNALHSPNFSEPTTDSLLLPGNCFTFFITADSIIIQSSLWFLPKDSNHFATSCLQPDINASCRQ